MAFMNLPIDNEIIDVGGLIVLLAVVIGIVRKIRSGSLHHFFLWERQGPVGNDSDPTASPTGVMKSFAAILFREVFAFRVLGTCSKTKRFSHIAIFWGFVFLGISTLLAYLTNPTNLILPLDNPVKLFGNAGGILVVAGFIGMFSVRYREHASALRLTRSDLFLITLFLTAVTGFFVQQAIYSALGQYWVSVTFLIHMVLIILLLATAPYTKFFHAVTKPVSLLYAEIDRRNGRETLLPMNAPEEK
jgi:nitrate reductase gamma subunit